MPIFWRALAALAALLAPGVASAEERILDFGSTIAIQKDGALDVTESILVNAERQQINHGIYRDFPTRYTVPNGGRMKVRFTFLDASLDGGKVDSAEESIGNGVRIKLGSPDYYISPGEHRYKIHYRVTRELGFFKDYDELYWNVTGTGWGFPIDRASATITLPSPATFGQRAVYTGPQGATASNAEVVAESPGSITFATTAPLAPYEGLTVAVAFPKGVVDEPTENQKLGWWLADFLPIVVAFLSIVGVIGFLVYAWRNAGRDPPEGTVVPLFAPPDDLSPAEMRYVVEQGFDDRAFATALVDAGVKGHVIIGEDKGFLFFGGEKYIQGTTTPAARLPAAEQSAISALVTPGQRLELDNDNHATFSAAKRLLESAFKARHDEKAFRRNYSWATAAFVVWLVGAYATALSLVLTEGSFPTPLVLVPLVLGIAALVAFRWAQGKSVNSCVKAVAGGALAIVVLGLVFLTVTLAVQTSRWQPLALAALGLPIALSAWFWISAPTPEGRALLDRIAGFKQYLSITERERLDRMQAPRDTLQMFERWLPYAIALEVENRWADRFSGQLAAAAAAGKSGFAWYAGSHSPWSDTGGFASSLGSSLSSSISSASTAPGSSSGSGGGGSSGGGGGGGGGGGW